MSRPAEKWPRYANLRSGSMAEPSRAGIPLPTLIAAAVFGLLIWAAIIWAIVAAWNGALMGVF